MDQPTEEAWTITYGAVVEMMLNGVTSDPENIPIEEEPQLEQSTIISMKTPYSPRKKLTYVQKVKLRSKKLTYQYKPLVLGQSKWTIALYAAIAFSILFYWARSHHNSTYY